MKLGLAIGLLLFLAVGLPAIVGVVIASPEGAGPASAQRDQDLAGMTARLLRQEMLSSIEVLKLGTDLFDLTALPPKETTGVLRMLYRQNPDLTVVALLDGEDQAVVEPAFLSPEQVLVDRARQIHLPVDKGDLGQFLRRVPLAQIRAQGMAFSDVYADARRNVVLLAGGLRLPAADGRDPYLLVFERSLRGLQQSVAAGARASAETELFVVDGGGRLVAHPDGNLAIKRLAMADHPLVARHLAGERIGQARFTDASGRMISGAFQRLDFLDWAVVVQRTEAAVAAGGVPAWAWLAWLAILVVIGAAGALLVRSVGRQHKRIEGLRAKMREQEAESAQVAADFERRAAELQRVQASLLETRMLNAIGDLGAGVAHELNNPLGGILGLTQLLLRRKKEGDVDLQFLTRIEEEAKRCKAITGNLLRFSEQQGAEHREPLRVERVMDKALDLIDSRLAQQRVAIQRNYQVGAPRIVGSEARLQRVFLNVLHNAETAMPDGGKLLLEITSEAQFLVVRISDTGRGIAEQNLARVFEPFFTTKDNWKGAGLGLFVVYQIVEEHGGVVGIESERGEGTTVTFKFPLPQESGQADGAVVPTD